MDLYYLEVWLSYVMLHNYLIAGILGDDHMLMLAKRITSASELQDFGILVLGMRDYTVDSTLYDKRDAINMAALDLLRQWVKGNIINLPNWYYSSFGLSTKQPNTIMLFPFCVFNVGTSIIFVDPS